MCTHTMSIQIDLKIGCDKSSLSPLFATHDTFLSTLAGGFGWHRPAAAGDRFPIAWDKDGPDRLLARGVSGGDINQLLGGVFDDVVRCSRVL
jgi:hypothetical protein